MIDFTIKKIKNIRSALQNYVLGGIIGEVEKQGYSIKQVYVAEYTDGYVDIYPFRQTKGFSFHKKR